MESKQKDGQPQDKVKDRGRTNHSGMSVLFDLPSAIHREFSVQVSSSLSSIGTVSNNNLPKKPGQKQKCQDEVCLHAATADRISYVIHTM